MPRHREPYPREFREKIVALFRAGRSVRELAEEFEPTATTIHSWIAQADRDEGIRDDGLTSVERDELQRLRRKVRQLEEEREILAKATAWFATESRSTSKKSSSS